MDNEDFKKNFNFEDSEELLNELNGFQGISKELSRNMQAELSNALTAPENILIVGTEGTRTITIVTAPQDVVLSPRGRRVKGPVLIPTTDQSRVLAMVSKEYIERAALVCQNMEDQDGAQDKWEKLLEAFFDKTIELAEAGGAILEIPDFIPEEGI